MTERTAFFSFSPIRSNEDESSSKILFRWRNLIKLASDYTDCTCVD